MKVFAFCSVASALDSQSQPAATPQHATATSLMVNASVMSSWLDAHNVYRCMHGVPNLVWSDGVAYEAQRWADNGVYKHMDNPRSYDLSPPAGPSGENIAYGYHSMQTAIDAWYNEVQYCSGRFPGCEGTGQTVGHFTAMTWKGARELGCGQGVVSTSGQPFYVCHYKGDDVKNGNTPNMGGYYSSNVMAPVRSQSQCGGGSATPSPSPTPIPSGARQTQNGCDCLQSWSLQGGGGCSDYCCNPDNDPVGDWCFVADEGCEGSNWGHCGGGATNPTNCVQPGSLPTCEEDQVRSQCLESAQCAGDAYCCPYMKKCITSGMSCYYPVAVCQPTCSSADGCNCPGAPNAIDYPNGWQAHTCGSDATGLSTVSKKNITVV